MRSRFLLLVLTLSVAVSPLCENLRHLRIWAVSSPRLTRTYSNLIEPTRTYSNPVEPRLFFAPSLLASRPPHAAKNSPDHQSRITHHASPFTFRISPPLHHPNSRKPMEGSGRLPKVKAQVGIWGKNLPCRQIKNANEMLRLLFLGRWLRGCRGTQSLKHFLCEPLRNFAF